MKRSPATRPTPRRDTSRSRGVPTEAAEAEFALSEERVAIAGRADAEFSVLEQDLQSLVAKHEKDLELVHAVHRTDAVNLLHYLALRRHDEHDLQRRLTELGLSSLGRCEPHVMASVLSIHGIDPGDLRSLRTLVSGCTCCPRRVAGNHVPSYDRSRWTDKRRMKSARRSKKSRSENPNQASDQVVDLERTTGFEPATLTLAR